MESQSGSTTQALTQLISALAASEQRLRDAAEHIRNRGLKLVVKTYAQQRATFSRKLQTLIAFSHPPHISEPSPSGGALARGWLNIKAAMTIRRRFRHYLLLRDILAGEAQTVDAYQAALAAPLPPETQQIVEQQHQQILITNRWLAAMTTHQDGRVLVRLFDDEYEADQTVESLQEAGFAAGEIYKTAIDEMNVYENPTGQSSGWRETVWAGSVLGFLVGALAGVLVGFAQRAYFPEWQNVIIPTPLGALFELPLLGGLIGSFFGFIFSLLIGIDAKEDDEYLYGESLKNGSTLVAVFAHGAALPRAEQIVGLRHGFEVKPALA
jgi:uncharacterized protein (TIGR02284 family)